MTFLLTLLLAAAPAATQQDVTLDGWRSDLRVLAAELPRRHPGPFDDISQAAWDSAVGALDRRLPRLRPDEVVVELRRLVALIGDGHTAINPLFDAALRSRHYPLDLHGFEDGLYVRSAAPEYARYVGARVVRIGRATAEEALAAVAPLIPSDNAFWAETWGPVHLMFAETLSGLGLVDDPDRLSLVLDRDGRLDTAVVTPVPWTPRGHRPGGAVDRSGWVDMASAPTPPLSRRNPDDLYWMEYVAAERLLYVSYRAVQSNPHGESNAEFWNRVFQFADANPVDRFVIDIRENSGGEGTLNLRVVRGVMARPALAERLFVIIGHKTFSAAMNLATELERYARPTFVGEPTGTSPHFHGDHRPLVLPASGITVNVSSIWWQTQNPRDSRAFLPPLLYTPMTAADYAANRDPALEGIRAFTAETPLADRMERAVLAGDTTGAERLLASARSAPLNRYRNLEGEVNALGYRLLRAHRLEPSIAVLRINVRAYPDSPNAHDSLGEAYETAGRRELAAASYRRALALDPDFPPSLAGLERLGR